jgi:hypothetical protein
MTIDQGDRLFAYPALPCAFDLDGVKKQFTFLTDMNNVARLCADW